MRRVIIAVTVTAAVLAVRSHAQDSPRFRSSIELVDVTATVTDGNGHFVSGLRQEDFSVYEDGTRQTLSHFSSDRLPVSLGILLDASGSMNPEKLQAARTSIDRLISDLLDKDDELFFVEFGHSASLTQEWTTDRRLIRRALEDVQRPTGDTAMYDAIALALPTAQSGRHGKKALLVISDGNDTRSVVSLGELRQMVSETDVLVYALGIDNPNRNRGNTEERLDADKLRQVTDDTGGRTELVRGPRGLDAAIARLADELRHQYSLGYSSSTAKDGGVHSIRVDVRDRRLKVRARRRV